MEMTIQSVNFAATEQLKAFVEKKVKKLERFCDDIILAEVIMKVIKPETANNKEVSVKLNLRHKEAFASKIANTFEEAVDLCMVALEKQIQKSKEKKNR